MATISFTIPDANFAEVKAAIDHHTGVEVTVGWTDADYTEWYTTRARSGVKQLVLKYRESQQAAVDTTDPTTD